MLANITELLTQAKALEQEGNYKDAAILCRQIIPILEVNQEWEQWVAANGILLLGLTSVEHNNRLAIETADTVIATLNTIDYTVSSHAAASVYNSAGIIYFNAAKLDECLYCYEKALSLFLNMLGQEEVLPKIVVGQNNVGTILLRKGEVDKALTYFQQALQTGILLDPTAVNLLRIYHNMGTAYGMKSDFKLALHYFEQALTSCVAIHGECHDHTASIYNNMGHCYNSLGNNSMSWSCYEKAIQIREKILGEENISTVGSIYNAGKLLLHVGQYQQALTYFYRVLPIYHQLLGENNFFISNVYGVLGICYMQMERLAEAKYNLEKSLTIRQNVFGKYHPDLANALLLMTRYYHKEANFEEALQYAQLAMEALHLPIELENLAHLPNYETCSDYSVLLSILKKRAVVWQAIFAKNQNPENLRIALAHYHYMDTVVDYLKQSYKAEGSKLALADREVDTVYWPALALTWQVYQWEKISGKKLQDVSNQTGFTFEGNVIASAYHFAEKSKAMLLFADLKHEDAKAMANIPPDLLKKEQYLRTELNQIDKLILEASTQQEEDEDKHRVKELKAKYFALHTEFIQLIGFLEQNYPDYYEVKYDTQIAGIAQVQQQLGANTALLSFMVAEEAVYLIVITAQNCAFYSTNFTQFPFFVDNYADAGFEQLVDDFLQCIAQQNDHLSNYDLLHLFAAYAHTLYQVLIEPAKEHINPDAGIDTLIIVPDAYLCSVPFEALLYRSVPKTAHNSYNHLPYLLHRYNAIQYHYSATLWLHQIQKGKAKTVKKAPTLPLMAGFAPIYYYNEPTNETQNRASYPPNAHHLPYTEAEIVGIKQILTNQNVHVNLFTHDQATPENVKKILNEQQPTYIHIAAHGYYNKTAPELSGLVMSVPANNTGMPVLMPDKNPHLPDVQELNPKQMALRSAIENKAAMFYINDAYDLKLTNTQLVVLSCCDSGMGKLAQGEGMIAINRGFLYAGALNVIYTLFKVDDERSYRLVKALYAGIAMGKTYAEALTDAKKAVLPILGAPFFWSGYVLIGRGK